MYKQIQPRLSPMRKTRLCFTAERMGLSDKHRGLLPGRFFKINQNKPLTFSSAELAICDLPSLYESVTLDSLDKPQMTDALMHLKKMTGNKHNKPLLERRVKNEESNSIIACLRL